MSADITLTEVGEAFVKSYATVSDSVRIGGTRINFGNSQIKTKTVNSENTTLFALRVVRPQKSDLNI